MSLPIWTADALSSEYRRYEGRLWRLVEAQHRVSTLKLVDDLQEQALLEDIIERSKPILPPDCRHLDYLLATPFRYGSVYPKGSRFRRAGRTAGVFYAAEQVETALCELVFYRFLFYAESPEVTPPENAADYTAFSVSVKSERLVDLSQPPLSRDQEFWCDPVQYEACQQLAEVARSADADAIRYRSVRARAGVNVAVLKGATFAHPAPLERQSWQVRIGPHKAQAVCDFPPAAREFTRSDFQDPRLDVLA
ncbi:RES family NAD+ phosphorylase [Sneathiella glossodoripedis]|uniref:RES family NAD+ phosphorylase n=1 Tax=Sneathiella glossodoripedis TaxID=418853 RepID=UPI000561BB23|nr:RES family NAD+ phosphorylase [Sneathiella glossodoripedis]